MSALPTLDAHAHFHPARTAQDLSRSGAVLAMTLSLDEAAEVLGREAPLVAWGVGCHPRDLKAQAAFDPERFGELAERAAVVGEVGLDAKGSRVPLDVQVRTFRHALVVAARVSRATSIHSVSATALVLEELRRHPVPAPILHWWTGTVAETREAVAMGAYFSVHSAVARHSKFRTTVPPERILVETDHGWADPPAAIPCRIEWVEHLVAQQLRSSVEDVRRLVWENLARLVRETETLDLLPQALRTLLAGPDEAHFASLF